MKMHLITDDMFYFVNYQSTCRTAQVSNVIYTYIHVYISSKNIFNDREKIYVTRYITMLYIHIYDIYVSVCNALYNYVIYSYL